VGPIEIKKAIIVAGGRGSRMQCFATNSHKGALDIGGKPNVVWLAQKLHDAGVRDLYVGVYHNAGDVMNVLGDGSKFKRNGDEFRIHYDYEDADTASASYNIVFNKFKEEFKNERHVWVLASDIGFPALNLNDFKQQFAEALTVNPQMFGAIGYIMRPVNDVIKKFPTALINDLNFITSFIEKPPSNVDEAKSLRSQSCDKPFLNFENETGLPGLPLPTFFYILSMNALQKIPLAASTYSRPEKDVDFYRHLFKFLPNQLTALFLKEEIVNKKLIRGYYDLNWPDMFYRAQYQFIRTAYNLLSADHEMVDKLNSFVGPDVDFYTQPGGEIENIKDNVIHRGVSIRENCSMHKSVIGHDSIIRNVVLDRSIILPYTYINYDLDPADPRPFVIKNSIVGCPHEGGTFVDMRHNHGKPLIVDRKIVTPDDKGQLINHDLLLCEEDGHLVDEAFQK
jgi:NDP-sugar pyrophosphorylase family protein